MSKELLPPDLRRRLDHIEILTRRSFMGKIRGEKRSLKKGQSLEFADYRNYVPGDDIRYIDWKVYARLEKLFLKLFMEEEDLCVHILLDVSLSMGMGDPVKLVYSKQLAASLAYLSLAGTHRVSIYPFSDELHAPMASVRGKSQISKVLAYLEKLGPGNGTASVEVVRKLRQQLFGNGYVFIVSDLLDKESFEPALKSLKSAGYEVVVLHLLSPDEEEINWQGEWRLIDVEDGARAKISMSERFKKEYAETIKKFRAEQKAICHKLGCQYVPIRSDMPLEEVLLDRLRTQRVLS
jgi:uncharacterized protein (DUF58 family)